MAAGTMKPSIIHKLNAAYSVHPEIIYCTWIRIYNNCKTNIKSIVSVEGYCQESNNVGKGISKIVTKEIYPTVNIHSPWLVKPQQAGYIPPENISKIWEL